MTQFTFTSSALPIFIYAGQATYPVGDTHVHRHDLGVFDLLVVTDGCLPMVVQGVAFAVKAGQSLLLPPTGEHGGLPVTQLTHFYWLHFTPAATWHIATDQAPTTMPDLYSPPDTLLTLPQYQPIALPDAAQLLEELTALCIRSDVRARLKAQIRFHELLLLLTQKRPLSATQAVAAAASRYLETHYRQAVTYQTLSAALNYSAGYITRCMRAVNHETPDAALLRIRLTQAKALLISTDLTIDAIAHRIGYPSGNYLSRRFTQAVGVTPSKYRHPND
ncbi:helix-turn-helix transcriptional regulator [Lacticaseibacillus jixiensis]|uniref:helix-turn-helix transcriptional regulator n=1 Tax=Lacticaseibacillus jixiensis TaxID=3231926 RepID=UPI0036F1EF6F